MAASAGGLQALRVVLRGLRGDLPAAVAIVQHRAGTNPGLLEKLLQSHSDLLVQTARSGDFLRAGTVFVAPATRHLFVNPDGMTWRLEDGPRISYVLSSADPLFASAARAFGPRVIAVILTGGDHDGTQGAQAVAEAGGIVVAQQPETAQVGSMPRSVAAAGLADAILPLDQIAPYVSKVLGHWT